jgi:hypothetical protein
MVLSGTICGLNLGDDRNRVVAQLGDDFIVEGDDRNCLYDYGLVEVYWSRPTTTEPWCLTGYSIEAMRLVHGHRHPAATARLSLL